MTTRSLAAMPVGIGAAVLLSWTPASAGFVRFDGDGICGPDARLATFAEVQADPAAACQALGELEIGRLDGGGSLDGSGLGCGARMTDERVLETSLCLTAEEGTTLAAVTTRAHNDWRAVVGVPPLVWSEPVAEAAQAYADELAAADGCPLVHATGHAGILLTIPFVGEEPEIYTGCDPADQEGGFCTCTPTVPPPDGTFCVSDGENLFKAGAQLLFDAEGNVTRLVQDTDGADVTNGWGAEKADYSLPTNSCAEGAVCGHYTQVVWGDTQQLGCGRALCANHAQVWVCRYRPAGNFPRPPYAASEDDFEVTLLSEKDTSLRDRRPNVNQGAADTLRIAGRTRSVVGFSAAAGTLGANVLAADLLLELKTSSGWPEAGGTVDVHALPQLAFRNGSNATGDGRWREGNGVDGIGATWNCSRDEDIADNAAGCYPGGLSPPWNGAAQGRLAFQPATAPGQRHGDDRLGEVRWDVSADVRDLAASEWLIKRADDTPSGAARYHAREAGDLGPRLILQLDRNF